MLILWLLLFIVSRVWLAKRARYLQGKRSPSEASFTLWISCLWGLVWRSFLLFVVPAAVLVILAGNGDYQKSGYSIGICLGAWIVGILLCLDAPCWYLRRTRMAGPHIALHDKTNRHHEISPPKKQSGLAPFALGLAVAAFVGISVAWIVTGQIIPWKCIQRVGNQYTTASHTPTKTALETPPDQSTVPPELAGIATASPQTRTADPFAGVATPMTTATPNTYAPVSAQPASPPTNLASPGTPQPALPVLSSTQAPGTAIPDPSVARQPLLFSELPATGPKSQQSWVEAYRRAFPTASPVEAAQAFNDQVRAETGTLKRVATEQDLLDAARVGINPSTFIHNGVVDPEAEARAFASEEASHRIQTDPKGLPSNNSQQETSTSQ
jgi:hypothetical protein